MKNMKIKVVLKKEKERKVSQMFLVPGMKFLLSKGPSNGTWIIKLRIAWGGLSIFQGELRGGMAFFKQDPPL